MPLIHRFTRLFTADLHAVLDRIEEPEILLRQAVRDMQAELDRMRDRLRATRAEREHAVSRAASARADLTRFDEELDVCFAAGEDALARNLVRRKLEAARAVRGHEERAAAADALHAELETAIAAGADELAALREKLDVLSESSVDAPPASEPAAVAADEVEVAFLREKQRRVPS